MTLGALASAAGRTAVLSLSRRRWRGGGDSRAPQRLDFGSTAFAVPVRSPSGHVWETAGITARMWADVDEAVTVPVAFGG